MKQEDRRGIPGDTMTQGRGSDFVTRARQAREAIDKQAPFLAYFSLGLIIAWNSFLFAGIPDGGSWATFKPHETYLYAHQVLSALTMGAVSFVGRMRAAFFSGRGLLAAAICACAGSLPIALCFFGGTAEPFSFLLEPTLLLVCGGVSGFGAGMLFLRSLCLLGQLPPRRSLVMFAIAGLIAAAIYFTIIGTPHELQPWLFLGLPSLIALTLSLKSAIAERYPLDRKRNKGLSRFFLSILLCSAAFGFLRASAMVDITGTEDVLSRSWGQIFSIAAMTVLIAMVLLTNDGSKNIASFYSLILGILLVLIASVTVAPTRSSVALGLETGAYSCFTLVVWAMLAYIVYQAQANGLVVLAFGSIALTVGGVTGMFLSSVRSLLPNNVAYFDAIVIAFGILTLVGIFYAFSGAGINKVLLPIEEGRLNQDTLGPVEKTPGRWTEQCREIAKNHHLTDRETEIFIELARGNTAQSVADKLVLSVYTVRSHTRTIYTKLDVHSRTDLARFVAEHTGL